MTTQAPPWIDYTNKDYASLLAAMLDLATQRLPEWTDQSPNDVGVMLLELFAYMGDTLFYDQDRIAGESFLETARERRSVLQMLRLIGYELRPPVPASADLTLLFANNATGTVTIPTGTQFTTTKDSTPVPISFYYRGPPISIDFSTLKRYRLGPNNVLTRLPSGQAADSTTYLVLGPVSVSDTSGATGDAIPVMQVDAIVTNEILGSSDGSPGQSFALARAPLISDSLVLLVDEGAQPPPSWTRVASLLESLPTDTSFSVRRDENDVAWIQFGDNTYGRAPRRGRNNIIARYLVGGGTKGNVPVAAISKAVLSVNQLKRVINVGAASGGDDAEGTAIAAVRGPQQFRSMGRAVTEADYELHAKVFGVAKVRATATGWNRVTLVVAPAGGGFASLTLKHDLIAYFDDKRMITTQVEIRDPSYVCIGIRWTLTVLPQYAANQVQTNAIQAVLSMWAFDQVDFAEKLFLSKIYEVVGALAGVENVFVDTFNRQSALPSSLPPFDGTTPNIVEGGTIQLGDNEIPGTIKVTALLATNGTSNG
jgi:Baseplate J-like protein